jgi:hypothetical protein
MQQHIKRTSTTIDGLCFLRGPYQEVISKTIRATQSEAYQGSNPLISLRHASGRYFQQP